VSPFVAGVDGGGTNARAVILDDEGCEVARATGPGAVASPQDPAAAADAVASVIRTAAGEAGVNLPLAALWAGLAGAGREPARSSVEDALRTTGVAQTVGVGTDVEAALYSALGEGVGILLLAGTGSVALGRSEDGEETRVGGWGERLGDEGSGFWIGLEALRRVARAADGRGEETELAALVMNQSGIGDPSELIGWLETASKAEVGALAPIVLRAEGSGDRVASSIVTEAVAALAQHVFVVHRRAGPWSGAPCLALWGGLVAPDGPLRERLLAALDPLDVEVVDTEVDPALGAAERALDLTRAATS
jgi:glucosamine kinase